MRGLFIIRWWHTHVALWRNCGPLAELITYIFLLVVYFFFESMYVCNRLGEREYVDNLVCM